MRDATFRLLPDFISGAMVMSLPVRTVRALAWIGIEDACPVSLQDALAFRRNVLRHAQCNGDALSGADHGIGDAGVAAGRVEQHLARLQLAGAQRFRDDARRGAILHRSPWVVPFGFAENFDIWQFACYTIQT